MHKKRDDRFRLNPVLDGSAAYHALAAAGDTLFLGGQFEKLHSFDLPQDAPEAPPLPADFNSIGWSDGTVWRQMGYGLRSNRDPGPISAQTPGVVKDILVDGDAVYAAGRFHAYEIGENQLITQNHIARWSRANSRWEGLNFGLAVPKMRKGSLYDGAVEALLQWQGDLYAAGAFSGSCEASDCEVEGFTGDYNFDHETLAR